MKHLYSLLLITNVLLWRGSPTPQDFDWFQNLTTPTIHEKKLLCGGVVVVMVSAYFLHREKKIIPRKFSIFCPTRFKTVREKNLKTGREEKIVSRKKQENSTREKNSLPEKKNPNFASQKPKKKP